MNSASSIKTHAHFRCSSFLSPAALQTCRFFGLLSVSEWCFCDSSSLFGFKDTGEAEPFLKLAVTSSQSTQASTSESAGSHDCNPNNLKRFNPTQKQETIAHLEEEGRGRINSTTEDNWSQMRHRRMCG